MNLFPTEYIKNGINIYLLKNTTACQKIYWVILFFIIGIFISLPFVYVDISVQNNGFIRPITEKAEIRANISELVDSIFVKEGQSLRQGDTILTFRQSSSNYQIQYQQKRIKDFLAHISDLNILSKGGKPDFFNSDTRQQEYSLFIQREKEQETNISKGKKDLQRNQILYEKGVISTEEYENYRYRYDKEQNVLTSLKNSQLSQWQNDLNAYTNLYEEMKTALGQQLKQKDNYSIISPVNGTLDQFSGIYVGSMIQIGSILAVISPDSTLYSEIYVSPRNIGYIYIGMPVNIRVSSFNYNEWGTISGKVTEISSDFMTDASGNNAFYKVKCSMDRNFLIRKNSFKGFLKKGMPISAHFKITRRSLFDLLYQKIDDCVNPSQFQNKENEFKQR